MSKRSNFERKKQDYYPTFDPRAIPTTFRRMIKDCQYAEPCCGEGDLIHLLEPYSTCVFASDIEDRGYDKANEIMDAMDLTWEHTHDVDYIITNPPFTRNVLLPMLDHFLSLAPTILLLPADLMHNKYFAPYMKKCYCVVSIGRLQWERDSKYSSTDNYCWYFFSKSSANTTTFYGRDNE